jgi:hypothetical protein
VQDLECGCLDDCSRQVLKLPDRQVATHVEGARAVPRAMHRATEVHSGVTKRFRAMTVTGRIPRRQEQPSPRPAFYSGVAGVLHADGDSAGRTG